jgi:hypothetical protein
MMRENIRSAIIIIGGIVIVAAAIFGYNVSSTNAIQALHNRYDTIIEAHVLIPPATASTLGQGHVSEIFTTNTTSIEFGTVSPGTSSAIKPLLITSTGVIETMYVHVATDLNTPGVTLVTSETKDLSIITRRIVTDVGTTYPRQLIEGLSKTPAFRIDVAPNTAGKDLTFHIIVSYTYLPP